MSTEEQNEEGTKQSVEMAAEIKRLKAEAAQAKAELAKARTAPADVAPKKLRKVESREYAAGTTRKTENGLVVSDM